MTGVISWLRTTQGKAYAHSLSNFGVPLGQDRQCRSQEIDICIILESDRGWHLLHSQAPLMNPYADAKRTTPTTLLTAKKQKIRMEEHMLHITKAFITPSLWTTTGKLGIIRPMILTPLRIVSCLLV